MSLTKKGYEVYLHSIEFKAFSPIIEVLPENRRRQLQTILEDIREKVFENLKLDVKTYSGVFEKSLCFGGETATAKAVKKPVKKSKKRLPKS